MHYLVKKGPKDPETLSAITDCDDIDEEVALHSLQARNSARWHSLHVRMDPMASPSRLSWVEGHTHPFSWAHFFAFLEAREVGPCNAPAPRPGDCFRSVGGIRPRNEVRTVLFTQ